MLVSNTSDVHSAIFGEDVQFDNQASRRFVGDVRPSVLFVLVVIISVVIVFVVLVAVVVVVFVFFPQKR